MLGHSEAVVHLFYLIVLSRAPGKDALELDAFLQIARL